MEGNETTSPIDPSKKESEDLLNQLTSDLRRLDDQEKDANKVSYYDKYRPLFLVQSTLLGVSYSIIWPTLWVYIKNDFAMSLILVKLVYGLTFVAYPVASMLSAYVVEKSSMNTKALILLLGGFEIVGNLMFSLNYHPVLPVFGRFIAGLGDAFYVILMKDMKSRQETGKNETMTMECLAAFILGVIVSPGINILTRFIPFDLKSWHVTPNNYPGLTAGVLFLIMEILMLIILPTKFGNDRADGSSKSSDSQEEEVSFLSRNKFTDFKSICIGTYSFLYTYVVALFEIALPIIVYEHLKFTTINVMLVYAVLGSLYAMILMFAMTVHLKRQLEISICISVLVKTAGIFGILFLQFSIEHVYKLVALGAIVLSVAILWASDDILFINLVRVLVPGPRRGPTHNLRKSVSKAAFSIAGVSVAFCVSHAYVYVGPILIFLIYMCFTIFVVMLCLDPSAKSFGKI